MELNETGSRKGLKDEDRVDSSKNDEMETQIADKKVVFF